MNWRMTVNEILNRILELREKRGWTEYRLSVEAEIPQSTISSWYRKDMVPKMVSIRKICKAFQITPSQFFAEHDEDLLELTAEQKRILNKWDTLSDKQKNALFQFLDSL